MSARDDFPAAAENAARLSRGGLQCDESRMLDEIDRLRLYVADLRHRLQLVDQANEALTAEVERLRAGREIGVECSEAVPA